MRDMLTMVNGTADVVLVNSAPVVRVSGEIDLYSVDRLRAALWRAEALTLAGDPLVVDCSKVTFLDSSGLHALCDTAERIGLHGAEIVLRNPPGWVRRTICAAGLDHVLRYEG